MKAGGGGIDIPLWNPSSRGTLRSLACVAIVASLVWGMVVRGWGSSLKGGGRTTRGLREYIRSAGALRYVAGHHWFCMAGMIRRGKLGIYRQRGMNLASIRWVRESDSSPEKGGRTMFVLRLFVEVLQQLFRLRTRRHELPGRFNPLTFHPPDLMLHKLNLPVTAEGIAERKVFS